MKVAIYLCAWWLLLSITTCQRYEEEVESLLPTTTKADSNRVNPEIYHFLIQLWSKPNQDYPLISTDSVQIVAYQLWSKYTQELQSSQSTWSDPNYYFAWYENNLAHSGAFTSVYQYNEYTQLSWSFTPSVNNRPGIPRSGSCTMAVFQHADILRAEIKYQQLKIGSRTITAHHTLLGKFNADRSLVVIDEFFRLKE